MARALVQVAATARRGDVVPVRALIAHPMESGFRAGSDGALVARDIIRRFTCRYDGEQVFDIELSPAIAANPYVAFTLVARASGTLSFTWEGDHGFVQTETATIKVIA